MHLARLKFNSLDTRQYPQKSRPAESSILPHLDEQGNQFSFLEFLYDTNALQLQNNSTTETTSPAYPQSTYYAT